MSVLDEEIAPDVVAFLRKTNLHDIVAAMPAAGRSVICMGIKLALAEEFAARAEQLCAAREVALKADASDLRNVQTLFALGHWLCECGQGAACYGGYDHHDRPDFHCDQCCDHTREHGWCLRIPPLAIEPEPEAPSTPEAVH